MPVKETIMPATVECPLCGKTVPIPGYDAITRTDALAGHIATEHVSKIRPATPLEGPPLPRGLGIRWPWMK